MSPLDTAQLDVTGDESIDSWRGVAPEDVDDVEGSLATLLRSRSRALLASLLRPHKRTMLWATALILPSSSSIGILLPPRA